MSLKTTYRFFAPVYDAVVERATAGIRKRSLAALDGPAALDVLVSGAGTGLDFPFLPRRHNYVALDLTAAMQARSGRRKQGLNLDWVLGDSMALPFAESSFDRVVLHLILAVVPQPGHCLAEAARVLRPGGRILIFDKFLRRGQRAPLRRAVSPLSSRLATRLDVVFEDVLENVPQLSLLSDEPALANGWFRLIELRKEFGSGL
ncbi:MAG TPA: class I SAM-dependent methyltransferase [Gallionellaceae bacterium]|nr:class I SAM-dependent methyltransferase [Gallionellaceae bacterium]